jgi:hypothetical protein
MRSKIRWFTEFCNSHYVSHFAAFFIDTGAKISVVESCLWFSEQSVEPNATILQDDLEFGVDKVKYNYQRFRHIPKREGGKARRT